MPSHHTTNQTPGCWARSNIIGWGARSFDCATGWANGFFATSPVLPSLSNDTNHSCQHNCKHDDDWVGFSQVHTWPQDSHPTSAIYVSLLHNSPLPPAVIPLQQGWLYCHTKSQPVAFSVYNNVILIGYAMLFSQSGTRMHVLLWCHYWSHWFCFTPKLHLPVSLRLSQIHTAWGINA